MAIISNLITEEMFEVDIPICIEVSWHEHQYQSFARGYHVYMDIWTPLVGEMLKCMHEPSNEVDENAIAIVRTDSLRKESIVGHMPQNISKICMLFLKVPNTSITAEVVGERLNRGGGYGLEIPVMYRFHGPEKLINWLGKKIKSIRSDWHGKVVKCLK